MMFVKLIKIRIKKKFIYVNEFDFNILVLLLHILIN